MTTNYKLTDTQFAQLFSPDTTVSTFKSLQKQVSARLGYIIGQMEQIIGRSYEWFDFDNEGGDEYSPGSFDPESYATTIGITGAYSDTKNADFSQYTDDIPTSWLKDDFETTLKEEFTAFLEQEAQLKAVQKEKEVASLNKNTTLAQQIFAKLNDEEKAFIVSPSFSHFQEQQRQEFHKKAKADKLAEKQRVKQYYIDLKKTKNKP